MNQKTWIHSLIVKGMALAIVSSSSLAASEFPHPSEIVYPLEICQFDEIMQAIAPSEQSARNGAQQVFDLSNQAQQAETSEDALALLAQGMEVCERSMEQSYLSVELFAPAFEAFPLFVFQNLEREINAFKSALAEAQTPEQVEQAENELTRAEEKRAKLLASIDKRALLDAVVGGLGIAQTQILLGQATVFLTEAMDKWDSEERPLAKTMMDLAQERTQAFAFRLRLAIQLFDASAI